MSAAAADIVHDLFESPKASNIGLAVLDKMLEMSREKPGNPVAGVQTVADLARFPTSDIRLMLAVRHACNVADEVKDSGFGVIDNKKKSKKRLFRDFQPSPVPEYVPSSPMAEIDQQQPDNSPPDDPPIRRSTKRRRRMTLDDGSERDEDEDEEGEEGEEGKLVAVKAGDYVWINYHEEKIVARVEQESGDVVRRCYAVADLKLTEAQQEALAADFVVGGQLLGLEVADIIHIAPTDILRPITDDVHVVGCYVGKDGAVLPPEAAPALAEHEQVQNETSVNEFRDFLCVTDKKLSAQTTFWRRSTDLLLEPGKHFGRSPGSNSERCETLQKMAYQFTFQRVDRPQLKKCFCCNTIKPCSFQVFADGLAATTPVSSASSSSSPSSSSSSSMVEEGARPQFCGSTCKARMEKVKTFYDLTGKYTEQFQNNIKQGKSVVYATIAEWLATLSVSCFA
jgi:hypothetical protein